MVIPNTFILWRALVFLFVFLFSKNPIFGQEAFPSFQRHNEFYISFGAGSSFLNSFPSDIYKDGNSNLQLGMFYERAFRKRLSFLTGLEFEQLVYNFDGDIQFTSNQTLDIIQAGPDKKYTGISQRNLALPLHLRAYFSDNSHGNKGNMFLQGGLRLVQSLDFTGVDGLRTSYFFRSEGEDDGLYLSDFANQTLFQVELMVGFKGQFFKRFDLLNASTLGVMVQLTPMLNEGSTQTFPMHFTWRFLF